MPGGGQMDGAGETGGSDDPPPELGPLPIAEEICRRDIKLDSRSLVAPTNIQGRGHPNYWSFVPGALPHAC